MFNIDTGEPINTKIVNTTTVLNKPNTYPSLYLFAVNHMMYSPTTNCIPSRYAKKSYAYLTLGACNTPQPTSKPIVIAAKNRGTEYFQANDLGCI
jgi:hypothetical protein